VFVRSDAARLAELVGLVDSGDLHLEVTRRIPLAELPALHAEAAAGPIAGKVIVVP
jgi:NADPH:quinone reductase-like Zn-dependent oxidoreductase